MGKMFFKRLFILSFFLMSLTASILANDQYIFTPLQVGNYYVPRANCIYKEKDLYVWMGTDKGAYRFDGAGYKAYRKNNTNNYLPGDVVNGIFSDAIGNFWVVTNNGLGLYNNENDSFETVTADGLKDVNIHSYCLADDGVYFGATDCIYKFDYSGRTIKLFHRIRSQEPFIIKFISCLPDGRLIVSNESRICTIDVRKNEEIRDFVNLSTKLSYMYVDSDNRIWIATYNKGLREYDSSGKLLLSFDRNNSNLSNEVVLCMEEQDSLLWMGTDGGGINILNKKNNEITVLSHISGNDNTLPSNSIKCLFNDDYNTVWAGSVRDGVINIQKGKMKTYREVNLGSRYGLSNPTALFLFQDSNGEDIWIGTDGEGLNRFNLKDKYFTHYQSTFKSKVASIASYSDNELLLTLYLRGFFVFNKRTGAMRRLPIDNQYIVNKAFYTETTVNLLNEQDNEILFITDKLHRYNTLTSRIEEIEIEGQGKAYGYFLIAGSDKDNIYLYDNRGIYSLKRGNKLLKKIYTLNEGIIGAVSFDRHGVFWIGSGNRLYSFSLKTRSEKSIETTLLSDITSVVPDGKGIVWIGSENQLYAYIQNDNSFAMLGASQGARPNEYLKKSYIVADDGSVYLGGSRGLLVIDDDFKIDATETPKVILTDVKIDGVPLVVGNRGEKIDIDMSWYNKSLDIFVASLEKDILRPKAFRFEIIGANKMVVESYKPMLNLRSLLPGENHVYISCSTRNGLWTRPVEMISIDVLPPWYRTWWFLLGATLLTCLIVIWAFRSMLRRKENVMKMAMKEHEKNIYEEKVRFLINMSHELRTPLTLIHAPLKRILESMKPGDSNYVQLSKIFRQSGRMKRLLNMVLDLRRMEVGENVLHKEMHDMNEWISGVVDDFVGEGSAMGIRIVTELDNRIGEVNFDVDKMEVVLTNLLVNAIKHSSSGSEIIIRSHLLEDSECVRVEIIDRGPGLQGLSKEKLFTRFYQGSNERYGTGIGLSYSKVLIELHKGLIGAEDNTDGCGATFFFEIPINDMSVYSGRPGKPYLNDILSSEDEENVNVVAKSEDKYNTENDVLLIVDDSVELLEFINEALQGKFKSIYTASNGKEAIEIIKKVTPNIIVSDVMMPEMNGYELCGYIKDKEELCNIPVILLTARNEEQGKQYGYKLGADAFLTKPFEVETLMEIIRNKLKSKEQAKHHYMQLSVIPGLDKLSLSNSDEAFLQKLNNIIMDNISNSELDINMICREIGMSRASFYNKLKALIDISGNEYINKIRLEHAIMLIKKTDMNFTEISEHTGFASSKYFSTSFKQYTGMTPTQYKKQCRAQGGDN